MKELDLKEFGKRLKESAKENFDTVKKLGEITNISNLGNYSSGSREMGSKLLYRLGSQGIDIHELIMGESMCKELMNDLLEIKKEINGFKIEMNQLKNENAILREEKQKLIFEVSTLNTHSSKGINSS